MKLVNFIFIFCLFIVFGCSSSKTSQEQAQGSKEAMEGIDSQEKDFIVDSDSEEKQEDSEMLELESSGPGELSEYTIGENDTLMLIAFKIYGNYEKWREIANLNPDLDWNRLNIGDVIKYQEPTEKFMWNPSGEPYLIVRGDTLGTISTDKYGSSDRWQEIWDNNKPMIKDPNLIFAGFTLYYIPDTMTN